MKNLVIAQSGGPSTAINATVAGICEFAFESNEINKVYGGLNGIEGILNENFIELDKILDTKEKIDILSMTPSAALGSCRKKLDDYKKNDTEYKKLMNILRKYDIGYFIYIGGNDSMDTVKKLSDYCKDNNINDIKIMGAPKTIDNDIYETDHTPGFGSAAKYIATTISEIACDGDVYNIPTVNIVEIMGRDAGWLTGSSCMARANGGHAPDLIYMCEVPFNIDNFIKDLEKKLIEKKTIVVAVSEGIKDIKGNYISESRDNKVDAFGHVQLSGVGEVLKSIVKEKIGCKVRSIELSLMQRCAAHIASKTDIDESKYIGYETLKFAVEGGSGKIGIFKRKNINEYEIEVEFIEIERIANKVKKVPLEWINEHHNDVTVDFINYISPLIKGELPIVYKNGIPEIINLK